MVFEFLPMHYGEISCYTVCALTVMVSAAFLGTAIYVRYNSKEFRRVEKWVKKDIEMVKAAINGHDDYIDKTTDVINKIHIDLAVQESSMKDLKSDISEIKKYISEINADIKTLLQREST